jgi:hypothetical protein
MGRHGHRGGRKHRDRSPGSSDDDSLDGSTSIKPQLLPQQQNGQQQQGGPPASVMNILSAAMPNLRSAHNRGGTGPLWKNDQVHIWRKDSVTIVNLRNEKEILPGLDAVMRQQEKLPVPPRKEVGTTPTVDTQNASGIPIPRNGLQARTNAPAPPPRLVDDSGHGVQAYLKEQLSRMHAKEPVPMLAPHQSALGNPAPPPPPPPTVAETTSQPAVSATLFGDPLWSSSAWDAFDQDKKPKEGSAGPSDSEKQTLDVLSGILGDLRLDPSAPPAPTPIAAVGTTTPPTPPFGAAQGPWTVAAPGMSPQHVPLAGVHGPPMQMQPGMKQPHPMPQQMAQQVFMGPNGVQYVAAYAPPQGFAGFPGAGMMPGQPMMYPQGMQPMQGMQGMQIVQMPQGWAMAAHPAQQPGKQMVPAGFQAMPAPAGVKTMTLDEYNRLIQQQMQAQQQHQLMLQQQLVQQQQQQQQHQQQQQAAGGFTVSGSSDGEPRNASANGVNIGARPFVPPRK